MAKKKNISTAKKKAEAQPQSTVSAAKSRSKQSSGFFQRNLLPILLIVITTIAMGPVMFNDYITLDDEQFITANPVVQNENYKQAWLKQDFSPHYKPLVYCSWITEKKLFGNNPYVMHTNNLILHLISTVLLFFCVMRISRFWEFTRKHEESIAFFTALLFGIHPLHVESVAWAIERKDVLFGMFYLAGMLTYLKYVQEKKQMYIYITGLLYLLCLLSKSMGITLIAVTFMIDYVSGRRDWFKMAWEKWPLYIPMIFALYMYGVFYRPKNAGRTNMMSSLGDGAVAAPANVENTPEFYEQIVIACYRLWFFLLHILAPVKLALVYPREPLIAWPGKMIHAAVAGVALLGALPFIFKKYRDVLLFGLGFFALGLFPILAEEGPGTNFGSDRYTYIPSIGIFLLMTAFASHALQKPFGRFTKSQVLLGLYCVILAIAAFFQARRWGSSFDLYNQAVNNYAMNWVALHYRGGANEDINNLDAAIADYSMSIEMDPTRYRPWFARGTLYLKMRKYDEAIRDMTATIELNPKYEKAWVNRGNAYRDLNRNDEAIADYNAALKINSRFEKALNNRGAAYLKKGMMNEALKDFNRVLELYPNYTNGYINRAALFINPAVKDYAAAIRDYDKALELEPGNAQARYFRGVALRYQGKNRQALEDVDQAIALNPKYGLYHYTRAQLLRDLGRQQESVQAAQQSKALGYNVPAEYLQ